jgi:hypothetical protein
MGRFLASAARPRLIIISYYNHKLPRAHLVHFLLYQILFFHLIWYPPLPSLPYFHHRTHCPVLYPPEYLQYIQRLTEIKEIILGPRLR